MFKKYTLALAVLFTILVMLTSPDVCIEAAKSGLLLWFNKILPSLLPFMILINILSGLDIMKKISDLLTPLTQKIWHLPGGSLFAFMMGLIAGYPMGGKVVGALYQNKSLSLSEAQKTLCFANNCGSLFIIGTIGSIMLHNATIGYFLVFIHFLSALIMSFILSFYHADPHSSSNKLIPSPASTPYNFSSLFNESVKNAMDTIVYVGAYIIFFSVIASIISSSSITLSLLKSSLLHNMPSTYSLGLLTSLLELSNGVDILCTSPHISVYTIAFLAFSIGFGGICIHFQTSYILEGCKLSLFPYIISKLMQGILSFILCGLCYPLFLLYTSKTSFVFPITWSVAFIIFIILSLYGVKLLNSLHRIPSTTIGKKYNYYYQK